MGQNRVSAHCPLDCLLALPEPAVVPHLTRTDCNIDDVDFQKLLLVVAKAS